MNHRYCQRGVCNSLRMIGATLIILHTSTTFAAEFIPLGFLPDQPDRTIRDTAATDISDNGLVVTGYSEMLFGGRSGEHVIYRWTRETGLVPIIDTTGQGHVMSADGSVVSTATMGSMFVWKEPGDLMEFNIGSNVAPLDIADDGSVVVGVQYRGGDHNPYGPVLRWTAQGGFEVFSTPGPGEEESSPTLKVSPDGSSYALTVAADGTRGSREPLRWTEETGWQSIGLIEGHDLYRFTGISADGSVLAGVSLAIDPGHDTSRTPTSLWRWTEETGMVVLAESAPDFRFRENVGPSRGSSDDWLSADGSVLIGDVRSLDGEQASAYRWTEKSGLQILPNLQGFSNSAVKDMSPDGEWLYGVSWNPPDSSWQNQSPWLWSEETGILDLLKVFEAQSLGPSIERWQSLLSVAGNSGRISADGRAVLGTGVNLYGELEGWIAYLDPIAVPKPVVDFDSDGIVDVRDIDTLVSGLIFGTNELLYDVSRDGHIDGDDLTEWLAHAASENGFTDPYLLGDANLDGTVNALDLNKLGQNWLASPNAWQWGDFNADGVVDALDLDDLAQNWLVSIPSAESLESVPEPSGISLALMIVFLYAATRFRARASSCS